MSGSTANRNGVPRPDRMGRIIAHRGASGVAPENTLAAFRQAASQGVRAVEFDVSLLGDGTPVIHHDATLDRCTDRRGPLARIGIGDLAGIDAGGWFGPAFAGEPLATLAAALDLLDALGLAANLELKPHDGPRGMLARAVAGALSEGSDWRSRMTVSSFDHDELARFRDAVPDMPVALLYGRAAPDWRERAAALSAEALHLDWRRTDAAILRAAGEAGLAVRVYTANDPAAAAALRQGGLSAVITDHPPRYLSDPAWSAWAAVG